MLDLFFNIRRVSCFTYKLVFCCLISSSSYCFDYADGVHALPKNVEYEWVARYLNSLNEDVSVEEAVDFLMSLKKSLKAKGYEVPNLTEMCFRMKNYLTDQNISVDEDDFNQLLDEIHMREGGNPFNFAVLDNYNFSDSYVLKVKSKKANKLSSKMTFGLIKCLGGGLLCIIPFPAVQAVGAGLVLNGINDCIDDARDQGDVNERMQKLDQLKRETE
jgi:hypothetical protein